MSPFPAAESCPSHVHYPARLPAASVRVLHTGETMPFHPKPIHQDVRFEPNERPAVPLALGLGLQYAMLSVASVVLAPTVLISVAGGSRDYQTWAVFAALVVGGSMTVLQAVRVWRIGAGYILVMGSTSAFLAVSVAALEQGGPGLLASLIIVSAAVQFLVAAKMSVLRRIFTPTVAGTVLMLIPVTVAPVILRHLGNVPEGASEAAAPTTAAVTLVVVVLITLRMHGVWRFWAPAIGLVAGTLVGGWAFGIYDTSGIATASWVGIPAEPVVGLDLSFGPEFWALAPAFVIVTLVGAMDTLGDSIAIQRVSWRRPGAIDFRAVQGAIAADGLGNLLSGLACTVPNTTYAKSISLTELIGVAARSVGVCAGAVFVVLAFLPKFVAAIIAIPGPVAAAYLIISVSLLFVFGMKVLLRDDLDYRKSLIVGIAFWLGLAFQMDWIFPQYFQGPWSELLGNGMTVGGLTVVALTVLSDLTNGRRSRLKTHLSADAHPKIAAFLTRYAEKQNWSDAMSQRLGKVARATTQLIIDPDRAGAADSTRKLLVAARDEGSGVALEFVAATSTENIEDAIVALPKSGQSDDQQGEDNPLTLLCDYTSSVRHRRYYDTDVITILVDPI